MNLGDVTLVGVARTVGYLLVGAVGTAAGALGLLLLVQPLRPAIYHASYLSVGPWSAEEASVVLPVAFAALTAAGVVTVLGVGVAGGRERATRVGAGLAVVVVALLALLGLATVLSAGGLPAAFVAVVAFVVAVPLGLRRADALAGGAPAFAGGVPVLLVILALLAFGLGWGGGYDLVAREVPADAVQGEPATFEGYPEIREDLLSPGNGSGGRGYCTGGDGRRTCRLPLRGYAYEARAARFLAEHGVRCRFRGSNAASTENRSFVAVADGTHYRISCQGYGD